MSPHVILISPDGEDWRVYLNGEAVTVHPSEVDAKRSAYLLAERLRNRAGARVELKLVQSD